MKKHVLNVKKPEALRMHPKLGPFTLLALDRDNLKIGVFNQKQDRALTFKIDEFKLDSDGTDFDLEDATTYTVVCTLGPNLLWREVLEARKQNNSMMQDSNGPFQVGLSKDNQINLFPQQGR